MSTEQLAVGIDVGGTNLRTGLVTSTGELVDFFAAPIDRQLSGDEILQVIIDQVNSLKDSTRASGIGVAVAASILKGCMFHEGMTTLSGLKGYPLCQRISDAFCKQCVIGNDANLTLLAEAHFGAAKGVRHVLLLTLGTGIGGGLMLNGQMYSGAHSSGVEIGLSLMPDWQSRSYQSIENLAAPGALMNLLGDPRGFLFQRAENGDRVALTLINTMFDYLGVLVTNAHVLLDLDLVLLSGGLASVGVTLRDGVRAAFEKFCPQPVQFDLQIELGSLRSDAAGVIGAACLYFQQQGWLTGI
ncbi:MAG: ROK family protein [Anaerolineales bacterium]